MSKRLDYARSLTVFGILSLVAFAPGSAFAQAQARWFSAWTVSHNARQATDLSNSTVRMFVRPTVSGTSVRVKLENTLGQMPVSFSSAFIGLPDSGASLVAGSNKRLTFGGRTNLTIAPGEGAWSDPVALEVKAFQRLAVSLDVASASDISTHTLGLVTNYTAPGSHAADVSGTGFTAVPPGGNVPGYPFYWL